MSNKVSNLSDARRKRAAINTDDILNHVFNHVVIISFIESFPDNDNNPITGTINPDNKKNITALLAAYTKHATRIEKEKEPEATVTSNSDTLLEYKELIKSSFYENSTGVIDNPEVGNGSQIMPYAENAIDPLLSTIHSIIKNYKPKPSHRNHLKL